MWYSREQISEPKNKGTTWLLSFWRCTVVYVSSFVRRVLWKWGNLPQGSCSEQSSRYSQSIFSIHQLFLSFLLLVIVLFFCFFHSCPSVLIMIYTAFSDSLLSGYICTPPAPPERLCNDDDSLRRLSFTSLRHFYTANNDQKDTMTLSKIRHNTYSYLHHKL